MTFPHVSSLFQGVDYDIICFRLSHTHIHIDTPTHTYTHTHTHTHTHTGLTSYTAVTTCTAVVEEACKKCVG